MIITALKFQIIINKKKKKQRNVKQQQKPNNQTLEEYIYSQQLIGDYQTGSTSPYKSLRKKSNTETGKRSEQSIQK